MSLSNKNTGKDNRRKEKREIQNGTHFFVSESSYANLSYYDSKKKNNTKITKGDHYGN